MDPEMPFPIGAVVRRKIRGSFFHYGIASEYYHPESKLQMIYQFGGPYAGELDDSSIRLNVLNRIWAAQSGSHTHFRVGLTDYVLFSEEKEIEVVAVPEDPFPVIQRAKSLLHKEDYNLLTRNCEHYANYALNGTWESEQSKDLTVGKVVEGISLIFGSIFSKKRK